MSETNKQSLPHKPANQSSADPYRGVTEPARFTIVNGQLIDGKTGRAIWQAEICTMLNEYNSMLVRLAKAINS